MFPDVGGTRIIVGELVDDIRGDNVICEYTEFEGEHAEVGHRCADHGPMFPTPDDENFINPVVDGEYDAREEEGHMIEYAVEDSQY